ncbi:NAD(P)-dependent oxidoreductase [Arthrobacter oryzae]|uniref:NAD(P)-dependent oxidoreductase n=1 Tax=Arthrobacter oryzae TaxID=409290 RepID=UPI00273C2FAE|nr:NAD(P)-dependent oxidoreductase [Arthrobacter oryzae]WLQ07750.1 NAD(P)-dependent oxidoreductase [Arthrobacter oryzae]
MPSTTPNIGFIGLGHMGSGMTRNLQKAGFSLVVTDLRPGAAAELVANGALWAETAAEVARLSDVIITMLPTPKHVEAALRGPNGILAGISPDATWIDMSTSVPDVAKSVINDPAFAGLHVLDAPVSGMSVGAANGTLQIFIGGESEDVIRMRPVLEAMGDPERILHVGGHGAGYAVKLMINQLWFSHLVATAEVLAVGTAAGVDLDVLRRSLIASPANSNFLEHDVLSVLDHGDYDEGFAIALACKDMGLYVDLSRTVGMPSELSALVEQIHRRARRAYGDTAGEMSAIRLYEDLLGVPLRLATADRKVSA